MERGIGWPALIIRIAVSSLSSDHLKSIYAFDPHEYAHPCMHADPDGEVAARTTHRRLRGFNRDADAGIEIAMDDPFLSGGSGLLLARTDSTAAALAG